jgi:hypothetical protein
LKAGALLASVNFYPWVASILFALIPKSAYRAAQAHFALSSEKVRRRMNTKTDRKDILSYVLKLNDEKGLTLPELDATASIIILAGSESTSTMLTATTNLLLRYPEKLEKLVQEVRTTFESESEITLTSTDRLEYLRAVFQEGFRLEPPVPTQIPRIVPPEGDMVCGHLLPGNVSILVKTYHIIYTNVVSRPLSAFPSSRPTVIPDTLPSRTASFPKDGYPRSRNCSPRRRQTRYSMHPHSKMTTRVWCSHSQSDHAIASVSISPSQRCVWS